MKLSKAKKLFKAGEIQICQDVDNIKAARKIHRYIDRMENGHSRYIVGEAAVLTRSMPFTDIGFVNLSDIKPSKKKTLKKRVKALEKRIDELSNFRVEMTKIDQNTDWNTIIRRTTEPKQ